MQKTVATSTTEAEYVAASMASKEAIWLQRLLAKLGNAQASFKMHCDSQGAVAMMRNPVSSRRTKHIDVAYHFVREMVDEGKLTVVNVGTGGMTADALTKALPMDGLYKCRTEMGMVPMSDGDSASARVEVLDRPATRAGGMADGPAGVAAAGPDGGVTDAPDGGVADAPDGGAADAPDGGMADARDDGAAAARDSGGASPRDGRRVTSGGTPPAVDTGAEFGAELGAPDGVKATRGVAAKLEHGRRRVGQRS